MATKYTVGTSRVPGVPWKKYFVKLGTRIIDGPFYEKKLAKQAADKFNANAISNPSKGKWIPAKAIKFNRNGSVSIKK